MMQSRRARHVYFDVTFLEFGGDLRGIPQVILQLIRLFENDPELRGIRYISTDRVTAGFLAPMGVEPGRVERVPAVPLLGRYERFHGLFSTFRYRRIAAHAGLLIHPELRTVLRSRIPQMVIYHDFIILEPGAGGDERKWMRYLYCLYKNRQAAKVRFKVANSEFTRARALALFPAIDPASVTACLLGARMRLSTEPRVGPVPGRPLRFLYVGSYDVRKNIPALLRNLPAVAGDGEAVLQLVGRMSRERESRLRALASELPPRLRIEFRGMVGDEELSEIYGASDFLLFPSLFEGFGLPLAEAMAHGVVACAFRNSSLPEIGGDAAILADVGDFAAWGSAVGALAADSLAYRAASMRSLARAAEFTEERMRARYRRLILDAMLECGAAEPGSQPVEGSARIALAIINYRNPEHTLECLDSLAEAGADGLGVLVVDNASGDGSVRILGERLRDFGENGVLLPQERNLGFAGGCNAAIRVALERGFTHVVLLNNDTRVDPDFTEALRRAVASHPREVLAGYVGEMGSGRPAHNLGTIGRWTGLVRFHFPRREEAMPPFDFISGCLAVVPARVFREVGLLREDYFMYCEDLEFSLRLRAAGVALRYVPSLGIRHRVSATVSLTDFPKDYYRMRNQTFTAMRAPGAARKAIYLLRVLGVLARRWGDRRLFPQFLRGFLDGMAGRLGRRHGDAGLEGR